MSKRLIVYDKVIGSPNNCLKFIKSYTSLTNVKKQNAKFI